MAENRGFDIEANEIIACYVAKMAIKSRFLKVFCAVVESESLQTAGVRVGLSASALSRIIAELEIDLGVELFDRSERRMTPTFAARAFYPRAREALLFLDELTRFGREIGRKKRPALRVAALSRHAEIIVAPAISRLIREDCDIGMVTLDLHAQREFGYSRLARPFDIGFGNLTVDHPDLETTTLAQSKIVVVVPEGHPLATADSVTPAALSKFPLVRLQRDTIIDTIVRAQLKGASESSVIAEVSHTHLALRMVLEGAGLHVTDHLAAAGAREKGCRLIPLEPAGSVPFLAFWPRQSNAIEAELEAVKAAVVTELRRLDDDS